MQLHSFAFWKEISVHHEIVYSTSWNCSVISKVDTDNKFHEKNANNKYLFISLMSCINLRKWIQKLNEFRTSNANCNFTHCFASEWFWMIAQSCFTNSARPLSFGVLTVLLLNLDTSFVMSPAITMKSQIEPKIILKQSMAIVVPATHPIYCACHTTKYPNGVLQSNGHLFIHTHKRIIEQFALFRFQSIQIYHFIADRYEPSRKN